MNVLAVAVHPDDETLGCGATLLRHAAEGDALHWLIVTAVTVPIFTDEQLRTQERQVAAVRNAYEFASLHWLKFPSTRLDIVPLGDLIVAIRSAVADIKPQVVYIPSRTDVHSDHRVVFDACTAVLKSFHMSALGVRRLLACEVPSETDAAPALTERSFNPNVFIDVSATFHRKLTMMEFYEDQVHPGLMPRGLSAIEALARHRGAAVGIRYAEAFMLIREIS